MLVDDHTMVRKGVRALIETMPGWTVCAEATDGQQAVQLAASVLPDLIVMDLSMPNLSGIDATIQLRKVAPDAEILILTMHESQQLIGQAREAGARGHLLKSDTSERLMEALESLSRHHDYFKPANGGTEPESDFNQQSDGARLTPRERQVVKLVAEGNTNKAIARILAISIKTVQTHRLVAMRKVGAKSSADLTLYAARNNLVQI
jgi:DNA-binding NarL/FixJ family response regulator